MCTTIPGQAQVLRGQQSLWSDHMILSGDYVGLVCVVRSRECVLEQEQKSSTRMCRQGGFGGPGRVRHGLGTGWGSDLGGNHGKGVWWV